MVEGALSPWEKSQSGERVRVTRPKDENTRHPREGGDPAAVITVGKGNDRRPQKPVIPAKAATHLVPLGSATPFLSLEK